MKINVKSIIKGGFLAACLSFGVNSFAGATPSATITPLNNYNLGLTEEMITRALGVGLTVFIAKTQKASKEFMNSFLYLSGLFFTNKTVQKIPNVSKDTINATINASIMGSMLPLGKQLLDMGKLDTGNRLQREKEKQIFINVMRYGTAFVAATLAQEAMVGGYGLLKTLIFNHQSA